jgi:CubicO group peptidase (beta-lactamase class C family)
MSMITLQQVLEQIIGGPMDDFLKQRLYRPLRMNDTTFNPSEELKGRCVPTEDDKALRKRLLQGEVHDPAAFACGGLSGNAGLFSSIEDVATYARFMLDKGASNSRQIICAKTIETWTAKQTLKGSRALGWDTKSPEGSSAGRKFSLKSFGHTGYTGTSIWIDPENGFFAVLLTNRVHPTSNNDRILKFRPRFHDAAFDLLRGFAPRHKGER